MDVFMPSAYKEDMSHIRRKPGFGVSDHVQLKSDCTTTEISDLEIDGLYCLYRESKGTAELRGCGAADLHLCFAYAKSRFS